MRMNRIAMGLLIALASCKGEPLANAPLSTVRFFSDVYAVLPGGESSRRPE